MAVEVDFLVRFGRDDLQPPRAWSESDIEQLLADDLYGRLVLRSPGQPEAFFSDELVALVAGACFQSMEYLAAGQSWAAYVTRYPGDIGLVPEAGVVTATFNHQPIFRAPIDELLPALYDCGCRALQNLRPVILRGPAGPEQVEALEALALEARQALVSAGLLSDP